MESESSVDEKGDATSVEIISATTRLRNNHPQITPITQISFTKRTPSPTVLKENLRNRRNLRMFFLKRSSSRCRSVSIRNRVIRSHDSRVFALKIAAFLH